MKLGNTCIQFEENEERLKIEYPIKKNTLARIIYTVLAIVWFGGFVLFLYSLFNPPTPRGINELPRSLGITWVIGVVLWLYVWWRYIGRMIMRWWQFYLANREILFISDKTLIVRRPVSIFGLTDAFDRQYTSPFRMNEEHDMLDFQYGNVQRILFGQTLELFEREALLRFLNNRFFPHMEDDEDDEEDDE